ncbi:MAG: hypothetical protein OXI54_00475 [Chloroflexota bacterium]|nr:hypothetical protein [Chloroflexota bacterium]
MSVETTRHSVRYLLIVASFALLIGGILACGQESEPDKSDPASYAQHLVNLAVERNQKDGLEKTVAYHNSDAGKDGEWYVFIVRDDGDLLATAKQELVGQNLNDGLGTDPSGYDYWSDMRAASSEGKWVSHMFLNPETGEQEPKRTWVVRDGNLVFGSGYYEDTR